MNRWWSKRIILAQIVNNPLDLPDQMNPVLRSLIEGLLCKGQFFMFQLVLLDLYFPCLYFFFSFRLCLDIGLVMGKEQYGVLLRCLFFFFAQIRGLYVAVSCICDHKIIEGLLEGKRQLTTK